MEKMEEDTYDTVVQTEEANPQTVRDQGKCSTKVQEREKYSTNSLESHDLSGVGRSQTESCAPSNADAVRPIHERRARNDLAESISKDRDPESRVDHEKRRDAPLDAVDKEITNLDHQITPDDVERDGKLYINAKEFNVQNETADRAVESGCNKSDDLDARRQELKRRVSDQSDDVTVLPSKRLKNGETNHVNTATSLPNGGVPNGSNDEDCEKENQSEGLSAMDLSSSDGQQRDVITLSDSDDEVTRINHDREPRVEFTEEEMLANRKLIKLLQSQLRNEEAKLVLLKKLRNSQLNTYFNNSSGGDQNRVLSAKAQNSHMVSHHQRPPQPPPLIRGQTTLSAGSNKQMISYRTPTSRVVTHQQQPPPLVMASRNHAATPPVTRPPVTVRPVPPPTETPAQRQAAAKLALRKQLEKTLLQIPPPKPPPPEMNFIPSLAGAEFIILIGLEEVVNHITDASLIARGRKNPNERLVCTPFTCVQCSTDYTPVWKREKPGSKNVICELCVTTNQKKALKHEHTNRLKSAFVKALQQEQEIERMQASATPPLNTPISAASSSTTPYKNNEHIRQNYMSAHPLQAHMRSSPQPMNLQNYSAPNRTFPFQLGMAAGQQKQTDLQRQYLLDMIPARSMQQVGLPWKSSS